MNCLKFAQTKIIFIKMVSFLFYYPLDGVCQNGGFRSLRSKTRVRDIPPSLGFSFSSHFPAAFNF